MFRVRPDVVHTHTAKAGALGRLAAFLYNTTRRRSQRCLIVHTFHGHVFSGYFGRVGSSAVRVAERCMAWLTDCIITVSGRQQREICERYRIAPTWKTHIVEVGIDVEPLLHLSANSGLREELGFARHHVVFGYVGRFAAVKDLATLIRAFAHAAPRASAARLMLVGGGEQEAALAQLVADLRLTDRVRFAGWRRDVPAIYGALDIGVLTSLNEGTPLALMEAMAAGKPVVATTVGGVEDIVSHERTGLVVAPGDLAGLSDAMTRLTVDPVMRLRLGQTAQGEMVSRFGLDRVLSNVIGLYVRALADRRALQPLHAPRAESS
jgi:glycosyltransferase involved in cell wall biosynthesis